VKEGAMKTNEIKDRMIEWKNERHPERRDKGIKEGYE
jgi:hypothetical protein